METLPPCAMSQEAAPERYKKHPDHLRAIPDALFPLPSARRTPCTIHSGCLPSTTSHLLLFQYVASAFFDGCLTDGWDGISPLTNPNLGHGEISGTVCLFITYCYWRLGTIFKVFCLSPPLMPLMPLMSFGTVQKTFLEPIRTLTSPPVHSQCRHLSFNRSAAIVIDLSILPAVHHAIISVRCTIYVQGFHPRMGSLLTKSKFTAGPSCPQYLPK